jgi:lipopolysaccharide transport system ATP-binding protein
MIAFVRSDGVACTVYSNDMDGFDMGSADGDGTVEMRTPPLKLVSERYVIHILVREHGSNTLLGAQVGGTFHVRHPALEPSAYGVFHEKGDWKVLENRLEIAPQSVKHGV